ncbi:MAG TPA: class I SAM-dependent methyltransferase [Pyrinomonadaceae bacterium]|nr:class I SAM-dependent methyltransferase [Pyrinomonadaceae bacterium]
MTQKDIAGKGHWDDFYRVRAGTQAVWAPSSHGEDALEHALVGEIERLKPRTLLEVGCGDSTWLPYLALRTGASVTGVDYSQDGCEMARRRLDAQGVAGSVVCADVLAADPEEVGQFDFVYSLGLVEHFTDLKGILTTLLKFVRPGGALFTEVPNLLSLHGLMVWAWQPELMAKHETISRRRMARAYEEIGLEDVRAHYLGVFSFGIVSWENYPRWPRLVPRVLPRVYRLHQRVDPMLRRLGTFRGTAPLAPYVYAVGRKPSPERGRAGEV